MEADESTHPEQVGLLGTQAVVAVADSLAHLIEESDRSQWRTRAGFHGRFNTACKASIGTQFIQFQLLMCSPLSRLFVTVLGYSS
jgi:hypothetical protein